MIAAVQVQVQKLQKFLLRNTIISKDIIKMTYDQNEREKVKDDEYYGEFFFFLMELFWSMNKMSFVIR